MEEGILGNCSGLHTQDQCLGPLPPPHSRPSTAAPEPPAWQSGFLGDLCVPTFLSSLEADYVQHGSTTFEK